MGTAAGCGAEGEVRAVESSRGNFEKSKKYTHIFPTPHSFSFPSSFFKSSCSAIITAAAAGAAPI
jgi:hypothetical protein